MSKRLLTLLIGLVFALCLAACDSTQPTAETENGTAEPDQQELTGVNEETDMEKQLRLMIDGTEVSVAWEDNEAVDALVELAAAKPLTIEMSMYGGFEQVGSVGASLPRSDKQTTTDSGDIVLYSGNQIVIFYGSNSWSYTRLGRITDKTAVEMSELLGGGDVTVTVYYS